jgi:addiction module HigA family antidote
VITFDRNTQLRPSIESIGCAAHCNGAPVHPGALMREILEGHVKMTITEAAGRMKISRPALYAVLNGTAAVTAEMALRFACLTGGAPQLYLNMQAGHDLELAKQRLQDELADIEAGRPQ